MTYLGLPILTRFLIEPILLWISCGSIMEYAAPIWDLHLFKDAHMLENIQRRAAGFIKGDFRTASVTKMLQKLGLRDLKDRRRDLRLALLFKVVQGYVGVSPEDNGLEPADGRTHEKHKHKFRTRGPRTSSYKYSFASRTISEWNRLPASIVEADSLQAFKVGLAALTPVAPEMPWSGTHAICVIHHGVGCRLHTKTRWQKIDDIDRWRRKTQTKDEKRRHLQ